MLDTRAVAAAHWRPEDYMIMKRPFLLCLCLASLLPYLSLAQETQKYLAPGVPVELRIDDLLHRMTVDEKVDQISDSWGSAAIPRLQVPSLLKTEGLHSQSYSTGATIFPQPIGMAATFDTDLIGKVGKQTAVEAKAAHIRESWSPVLDVARDVRWGRVEETYGESPFLVSRMGVAWIEGFQGEGMFAVPKHFAGHGQPMGGRDSNDIGLSVRVMREIHLPSFRAAIEEAHAGGIMAAYGLWDGVPDNASATLLTKILRQEWGFEGFVVSDCGALENLVQKQGIVETMPEAAALGIGVGVNMNCGSTYKDWAAKALEKGLITESQLDDAVRPILRAKFKLGLFEHPEPDKMVWEKLPEYDTAGARALAREVAVEGAVLLKNDNSLLPLNRNDKTIAVIGANADSGQTGDYSPTIAPNQLITVLKGIQSHVGPNTRVLFAPGLDTPLSTETSKFAEAIAAAKQADVAIVVVGDSSHPGGGEGTTGENRDGATLDFPGAQRELIKAIQTTGTPVVLVMVNGKPFTLDWEADHVPAILVTWYPGEEGGDAAADLLFGDRNPSGRLPLTWPRDRGQLPLNYDYQPSGRRYDYYDMSFDPQWRFGYGLSYTQFRYSNLRITPKDDDPGFVTVTADVENTGSRDGDEVSQLYVTDLIASVVTPVVELKGIQRISLKAGKKKTITFQLTPYQLSLLDANMVRRVEPGQFRIHVGGVCPDVPKRVIDGRKTKIGFSDPLEGVSGEFDEPKEYSARFVYTLDAPDHANNGQAFSATVTVRNEGNLTDVTEAKLYDGFQLDSWSFELKPGEMKSHLFQPTMYRSGNLAVVADAQMVTKEITLEKAPSRLELQGLQMRIDNNSVLQVIAEAQDVGSYSYEGVLTLKVDGKPVSDNLSLELQPGEKRHIALTHAFDVSGLHRIQINDLPEQQIVVPGGISLSLENPLVYLKLDEGRGATVKNEITGQDLKLKGHPPWVAGRNGKALQLTASGMGIDAGNLDTYRKAFTLSVWVRIDQLGKGGDLALFGGQAPMGADQGTTGTQLQVGIHNGKLFMGFHGREVVGKQDVPAGNWVNLTYTYNPVLARGSVYINGAIDGSLALEPYAGPLETIGDAPELEHGSYALDEVVVVQSALTPQMVRMLYEEGLESFRQGEYISRWRTWSGSIQTLQAVADIPDGSNVSVIVEAADKDGKILGSSKIDLKPGQSTYPLQGPNEAEQIRLRVQLSGKGWRASPILRAIYATGESSHRLWVTPNDWSGGNVGPGLATRYSGQP